MAAVVAPACGVDVDLDANADGEGIEPGRPEAPPFGLSTPADRGGGATSSHGGGGAGDDVAASSAQSPPRKRSRKGRAAQTPGEGGEEDLKDGEGLRSPAGSGRSGSVRGRGRKGAGANKGALSSRRGSIESFFSPKTQSTEGGGAAQRPSVEQEVLEAVVATPSPQTPPVAPVSDPTPPSSAGGEGGCAAEEPVAAAPLSSSALPPPLEEGAAGSKGMPPMAVPDTLAAEDECPVSDGEASKKEKEGTPVAGAGGRTSSAASEAVQTQAPPPFDAPGNATRPPVRNAAAILMRSAASAAQKRTRGGGKATTLATTLASDEGTPPGATPASAVEVESSPEENAPAPPVADAAQSDDGGDDASDFVTPPPPRGARRSRRVAETDAMRALRRDEEAVLEAQLDDALGEGGGGRGRKGRGGAVHPLFLGAGGRASGSEKKDGPGRKKKTRKAAAGGDEVDGPAAVGGKGFFMTPAERKQQQDEEEARAREKAKEESAAALRASIAQSRADDAALSAGRRANPFLMPRAPAPQKKEAAEGAKDPPLQLGPAMPPVHVTQQREKGGSGVEDAPAPVWAPGTLAAADAASAAGPAASAREWAASVRAGPGPLPMAARSLLTPAAGDGGIAAAAGAVGARGGGAGPAATDETRCLEELHDMLLRGGHSPADGQEVSGEPRSLAGAGEEDDHARPPPPDLDALKERLQQYRALAAHHAAAAAAGGAGSAAALGESLLWTEKYRPLCAREVCGNDGPVLDLHGWLARWRDRIAAEARGEAPPEGPAQPSPQKRGGGSRGGSQRLQRGGGYHSDSDYGDFDGESDSDGGWAPRRGGGGGGGGTTTLPNTLLLSGPFGCGKTAAAYAVAHELGYRVIELNASERRSGAHVLSLVGEATQSRRLGGGAAAAAKVAAAGAYEAASLMAAAPLPPPVASIFGAAASAAPPPAPTATGPGVSPVKKKRGRPPASGGSKGPGGLGLAKRPKAPEPSPPPPPRPPKQPQAPSSGDAASGRSGGTQDTAGGTRGARGGGGEAMTLVLFEEVDNLFEDDRGFMASLAQLMTSAKRPLILTSNTASVHQLPHLPMRSVSLHRPSPAALLEHVALVCLAEGIPVPPAEVARLCGACGWDLRRSLHEAMYAFRGGGGGLGNAVVEEELAADEGGLGRVLRTGPSLIGHMRAPDVAGQERGAADGALAAGAAAAIAADDLVAGRAVRIQTRRAEVAAAAAQAAAAAAKELRLRQGGGRVGRPKKKKLLKKHKSPGAPAADAEDAAKLVDDDDAGAAGEGEDEARCTGAGEGGATTALEDETGEGRAADGAAEGVEEGEDHEVGAAGSGDEGGGEDEDEAGCTGAARRAHARRLAGVAAAMGLVDEDEDEEGEQPEPEGDATVAGDAAPAGDGSDAAAPLAGGDDKAELGEAGVREAGKEEEEEEEAWEDPWLLPRTAAAEALAAFGRDAGSLPSAAAKGAAVSVSEGLARLCELASAGDALGAPRRALGACGPSPPEALRSRPSLGTGTTWSGAAAEEEEEDGGVGGRLDGGEPLLSAGGGGVSGEAVQAIAEHALQEAADVADVAASAGWGASAAVGDAPPSLGGVQEGPTADGERGQEQQVRRRCILDVMTALAPVAAAGSHVSGAQLERAGFLSRIARLEQRRAAGATGRRRRSAQSYAVHQLGLDAGTSEQLVQLGSFFHEPPASSFSCLLSGL